VSFAAITLCVASQRVFVVYFVMTYPETFGYTLVLCHITCQLQAGTFAQTSVEYRTDIRMFGAVTVRTMNRSLYLRGYTCIYTHTLNTYVFKTVTFSKRLNATVTRIFGKYVWLLLPSAKEHTINYKLVIIQISDLLMCIISTSTDCHYMKVTNITLKF